MGAVKLLWASHEGQSLVHPVKPVPQRDPQFWQLFHRQCTHTVASMWDRLQRWSQCVGTPTNGMLCGDTFSAALTCTTRSSSDLCSSDGDVEDVECLYTNFSLF